MPIPPKNEIGCSAGILVGGKSLRMGTNKAFLPYLGRSFVHILIGLLRSSFREVFLIGKDREAYSGLGVPFIKDIYPKSGAAVGIVSGLQSSKSDWMFFCAVDMPFINQGILSLLMECLEKQKNQKDTLAIVPRFQEQLEPLCAIYCKSFAQVLHAELKSETTPSLRHILKKEGIAYHLDVPPSLSDSLRNINTPIDYERLGSNPIH